MKPRFLSEFCGTLFLVMMVLGSGIMGQNLFPGQTGLALLANSIATGAGLFVLVQCLGPISGAHLNPIVSMVECLWKRLEKRDFLGFVFAQMSGAYIGVVLTHIMFGQEIFQLSSHDRSGLNLLFSEGIATFGLICVVGLAGRKNPEFAPFCVASYIASAYWFTSSTSFANPAVTFARMFTNSFGGMSPVNYLPYVGVQVLAGILGGFLLSTDKKA